jgi:hypothetical protein
LLADLSPAGALGRDGVDYAFDTAIGLSALRPVVRGHGHPQLVDMYRFIAECVRDRRATSLPADAGDGRWSLTYGCHLLKLVGPLRETETAAAPSGRDLIRSLVQDQLPLFDHGRFRVNHESERTYVHAHCYAVEGLLALPEATGEVRHAILGGAAWLAENQTASGGIRAWHDGTTSSGAERTDATAQAVRIWACIDSKRYRSHIKAATAFLLEMQSPRGGLYYETGSTDINTWSTVFALQALRFVRSCADATTMV